MNLCTKQTAAKFLAQKHDFDCWLFLATNAALRGEQRKSPNLNYCAINTKAKLRTKIAKR
ncbi:hypothetical protein F6475_13190 [Vibrio alginolyticus]|nr:hypothetical protein F6475_13190 [Vibrio alginolyticus]